MLAVWVVQGSVTLIKEYGPLHGRAYGHALVQFSLLQGFAVIEKVCRLSLNGTKPFIYYPLGTDVSVNYIQVPHTIKESEILSMEILSHLTRCNRYSVAATELCVQS